MQRPFAVALVSVAVALTGIGVASAHDRESNNGVSVTLHVNPDDEPIATAQSVLLVEKVETRATFTWATCRCTWRITNAAGKLLYLGKARVRTPFVFPESGAYQLRFVGRVKVTKVRWRVFRITYALRADPPAGFASHLLRKDR
jgi:hypothetical protein